MGSNTMGSNPPPPPKYELRSDSTVVSHSVKTGLASNWLISGCCSRRTNANFVTLYQVCFWAAFSLNLKH